MDNQLAYLAGFIDGEGSIAIGINNGNNGQRRYYLRLSAHQIDKRPLQILLDRFGGTLKFTPRRGNQRGIWEWAVFSKDARRAIDELRPFLIVKSEQADVGVEFQKLLEGRLLPKTTRLSLEEQNARHSYYEKIKAMKWETTT